MSNIEIKCNAPDGIAFGLKMDAIIEGSGRTELAKTLIIKRIGSLSEAIVERLGER